MAHKNTHKLFRNDDLDNWEKIGSGGFGVVYKVVHKSMGHNLAIKLLQSGISGNTSPAVFEEAKHLEELSSEYVLRIYGLYEGIPPSLPGMYPQRGIVMEFMGRGSIETLQKTLSGPPPLPLAFRLAYEVALGMNFLHSKRMLHRDLKPNNVMLNDNLNGKLADFGLCTYSASASNGSQEVDKGGTLKYMPPEAFEVNYKPVRSFDLYSYGVLLWSLFSGQEPYQGVWPCIVMLRVPQGDRPCLEEIMQKDREGMTEVLDLLTKCWDGEPSKRPTFKECVKVSERVYLKHRKDIHDAVFGVLKKLDSNITQPCETKTELNLATEYAVDKVGDQNRVMEGEMNWKKSLNESTASSYRSRIQNNNLCNLRKESNELLVEGPKLKSSMQLDQEDKTKKTETEVPHGSTSDRLETFNKGAAWSPNEMETDPLQYQSQKSVSQTKLKMPSAQKGPFRTDTSWIRHQSPDKTTTVKSKPPAKTKNVSGKHICHVCATPLGKGDAMTIESLQLYYHLGCFKCSNCKSPFGASRNPGSQTEVRIKNQHLYCKPCYSRAERGKPKI